MAFTAGNICVITSPRPANRPQHSCSGVHHERGQALRIRPLSGEFSLHASRAQSIGIWELETIEPQWAGRRSTTESRREARSVRAPRNSSESGYAFLGLTPHECGHIEIVGNILNHFGNVPGDLPDNVGLLHYGRRVVPDRCAG